MKLRDVIIVVNQTMAGAVAAYSTDSHFRNVLTRDCSGSPKPTAVVGERWSSFTFSIIN